MSTHASLPRLFGDGFSERPHDTYAQLRAAGPVAWAEIAEGFYALVVTSWAAARELLNDRDYTRGPEAWSSATKVGVPHELAYMVLPGLQHTDGLVHERLRRALDECIARINLHGLRQRVQDHASSLIEGFSDRGHADLMGEYAERVVALNFAELVGCEPDTADLFRSVVQSLAFSEPGARQGWSELGDILRNTVETRKKKPGADLTSWLLAHPSRLNEDEVAGQLASLVILGAAPTAAWIGSTLHALLTDPAYASQLVGGAVTIRTAMTETLSSRCPVGSSSVHYARQPKVLCGVQVPAGVPIMVSHAATGLDPNRPGLNDELDRSHLAWSAGVHRCPAPSLATTIAEAAIESAINTLWDLSAPTSTIADKQGPFVHCPAHVGVLFSPAHAQKRFETGTIKGDLAER